MADENDNSLYMAGGNKIFNQMQRLTAKQEKVAGQQQQIIDENKRDKAKSVSNIKRISENQGGKPLTSENVLKLMNTLTETIVGRVGQLTQAAEKQIGPIDEKLKKINDLLSSNREDDMDKGFELIDKLEKVGVDFNKFSEKTAKEMQKLFTLNANRKANNEEEERIRIEKTQELTIERDILREQGINTYVNEKTLKLEIKSKKEDKAEMKRLQKEEQRLQDEQKRILGETKDLKKLDPNDAKRQDKEMRILADSENLAKDKKKFEEDKSKANIQPGQRVSGMLDQTVGEAFRQIKTFGKEIIQLGGDLFKGFGKLAGVVGKLALGFLKFLLVLIPILLIVAAVGIVIYALYKAIKSVIDFFANIFDGISKIWPFSLLKDDNAENEKVTEAKKDIAGKTDANSEVEKGRSTEKVAPGTLGNRSDAMSPGAEEPDEVADEFERNTGMRLTQRVPGRKVKRDASFIEPASYKQENINKMSVENQALSESKSSNNTVIAPNVSNSSVNASNTQAMSMEPTNFDRSFINLNSVPV